MKSFRSGTCARTLLPTTRLARRPSATRRRASVAAEEVDERRHAALFRGDGDVRRRIDAEDRYPGADEVLEEVAVVGRELDDEVVRSELEPLRDHLHVLPRVLDPRCRVAGEVRVLGEDLLRRDELGKLDEPAPRAHSDVQGVEALQRVQRFRGDEVLARR